MPQPAPAPGRTRGRPRRSPSLPTRAVGYTAAAWCLGFAAVSAWQIAASLTGQPQAPQRDAAHSPGLLVMSVLVGVLKLAGAGLALAAVRARRGMPPLPRRLVGVGLWGAFGLLGLYSAGNLVIAVGTVSGLLAPRRPGPRPAG